MAGNIDYKKCLQKIFDKILKQGNTPDKELISKAFWFAEGHHRGQKRASGEPYITHPIEMAYNLAEHGFEGEVIAAALMHDLIEDTGVTYNQIKKLFGKRTADLVEGVTDVAELARKTKEEELALVLQKIFLVAKKDVRVLLVKLADVLHNMKTISFLPKERSLKYSQKVLDVYAPLAHRLGLHSLKYTLEDLAFQCVNLKEYNEVKEILVKRNKEREKEYELIIKLLKRKVKEKKINAEFYIFERPVHNSLEKAGYVKKSVKDLEDLAFLIVLVDSEDDCYRMLGLIHKNYPPKPKKIKDFIAIPKGLYQSLHTSIVGPKGHTVKVYIRTHEMEDIRNRGIVPLILKHPSQKFSLNGKFEWLHGIHKLHKEFSLSKDFLEALKKDYLDERIIVYNKDGIGIELPINSTSLDFVYLTDFKKADYCIKAKVNGVSVPFWENLQSGDKIELEFSNQLQVDNSWINYVRSPRSIKLIEKSLEENEKGLKKKFFSVNLQIKILNVPGVLYKISKLIADKKINIVTFNSLGEQPHANCNFTLAIHEKEQLDSLINEIKGIEEVSGIDYFVVD